MNRTLATLQEVQLSFNPDEEDNSNGSVLGKRSRNAASSDDDELDDSGQMDDVEQDGNNLTNRFDTDRDFVLSALETNENVVAFARQIGLSRRLDEEDIRQMEKAAKANLRTLLLMILAEQLTNKSQMQKLYVEKAPWKPSKELKANIMYSAGSLLLSSKTPAYRASSVIKALSDYVEHHYGGDLPPDLKTNHAAQTVLMDAARYSLTQVRGNMKKALKASVKEKNPKNAWNIVRLAEEMIKMMRKKGVPGTESTVKITIPLCSRFAMMRSVYCDHNDEATENSADDSDKYWVSVDNTLVEIRNMSNGNKALENKLFATILEKDRNTYGVRGEYSIAEN